MVSFGREFQSEIIPLRSDADTSLLRVAADGQSYLALLGEVKVAHELPEATTEETNGSMRELLMLSGCPAVIGPVEINGSVGVLLEDFGGLPLEISGSNSRSLDSFLQTSLAICQALLRLHENNLVHGDIRPANIMIQGQDIAYLIASNTAFQMIKRPVPRESDVLAQSRLPYLSPEATGRLDRLPDMRSDLYSLGVTLYEFLTGKLPFAAKTAADWIHSHLARPPLPPGRWTTNIPSAIASVLMKLLAKAAEERYQTLQGLIDDLEFCRSELARHGRIELAELGRTDARGTLVIPDQLYGREPELLRLSQA
ncbi:serine/threonine protein kinase, partial [Enterobacter cloacae]